MLKLFGAFLRKRILLLLFFSFAIGIIAAIIGNKTVEHTSNDEFCTSCHVHPHVFVSWKLSTHYDNKAGIQIHCVDAYEKVLATGVDVVILATPPHFRPMHFEAAVQARKHIFMEKPIAVDPVGIRSVMVSAKKSGSTRSENCNRNTTSSPARLY